MKKFGIKFVPSGCAQGGAQLKIIWPSLSISKVHQNRRAWTVPDAVATTSTTFDSSLGITSLLFQSKLQDAKLNIFLYMLHRRVFLLKNWQRV